MEEDSLFSYEAILRNTQDVPLMLENFRKGGT